MVKIFRSTTNMSNFFVQRITSRRIFKRLVCLLLLFVCFTMNITYSLLCAEPDVSAPSAILMEASTGRVIYEKDADTKLRPASITKIMTLILIFDALADGKITLDETVTVSEHAASMGGSQVFLEPGETQTVETMIKCIAIASANDACVAMAEHICGSEGAFVDKMNERATGLGMRNTHFVNCCGLDDDGHETTARDVAYMSRELITKYPQIHDYSTIWMDTIIHSTRRGDSDFGLTNTNKLIRQYEWATGLKTGSTSLAGFCLSATANKNDIDLIAVVMHSPTGKQRVADCISLLNYGYGIVSRYEDTMPPELPQIKVKGGVKSDVNCSYSGNFSYIFMNSYDAEKINCHFELLADTEAPVCEGDTLGMLVYEYDGTPIGSIDIVACESIKKAGYIDYIRQLMRMFF